MEDGGSTESDYRSQWLRAPLPALDPQQHTVTFQQMELDHYLGEPIAGMPGSKVGPVPIVQMFGVTKSGNSVMAHVHGFSPYFFTPAPQGFTEAMCDPFRRQLEKAVLGNLYAAMKDVTLAVLQVELCMKESIYKYHGNTKLPFLCITVSQHRIVQICKRVLENGFPIEGLGTHAFELYETNVEYNLRFMIDRGVVGCNWIELPAGKYTIRDPSACKSTCQLEIDIAYDEMVSHKTEGIYSEIAPLRVLSFDIECAGRKGIFPEAEHDPVIQIANMVMIQGESKPMIRNVFTLNTCANIVGSQVLSFEKEKDLLEAWAAFVRETDADIITGYNTANFDFPYLIDRAKALKCDRFPFLGRLKNKASKVTVTNFTSKAFGSRDSKDMNIDGRVKFDMLQVLQRDQKLRSYTLNAVSGHFLDEQKEDVHHSIITDLQNGNDQTRRRLAVYCMKDAYLPLRLMNKLMCIYNYTEMARVTGVPFTYLLTRGQQIKVISQLMRRAREQDLVIPVYSRGAGGGDEMYEGATVIDPTRGYYDLPIATLDFASLYPSIMMAHNLCYTTLVSRQEAAKLPPDHYIKTPTGDCFVTEKQRKGLLPEILNDLLTARKRAKKDLKAETDPFKRAVLDGRQLALKVSANSVYGFTGATVGRLPCIEISASTTAFGRSMIEQTRTMVHEKYCIAKGFPYDAQVIYGDTDSVMIKFGISDMTEVMKVAEEAAAYVTESFVKPIKLEFEKVYFPYLLINKKRYAGLYWTRPDKYDKMDTKGMVTVRRDNCRLVVTLINTCLRKLLIERDVPGAISYAKGIIADLLQNRVDISQLVITKALSRAKEDYSGKQAHVELAERMRKRDPGSAPSMGDRVPYVIIQKHKGAPAFEKSEDPIFVLDNNIPIDTTYYLENQLMKPLLSIFEPIMGETKAQSLMKGGSHTLKVVKMTSKTGGLMRFTKVTAKCMGCKAALRSDEKVLCGSCKSKESQLYQCEIAKLAVMEKRFSRLWSQCQRCQGSLHQDVLCSNSDCPIFYMRKKVQNDMKSQDALVQRFSLSW